MERLTTDTSFCEFSLCDADPEVCGTCDNQKRWERLQAYEQTGLEPDEIKTVLMLNRSYQYTLDGMSIPEFLELVEAKKEDRLIVLPVAPGTTVYEVKNNTDACCTCRCFSSWFGTDAVCSNEAVDPDDRSYPNCAETPICEKQFMEVVEYKPRIESIFNCRDQYGETIFPTREEAEDALEKGGGD